MAAYILRSRAAKNGGITLAALPTEAGGGARDMDCDYLGKLGLIDQCMDPRLARGTACVPGPSASNDQFDSFRPILTTVKVFMRSTSISATSQRP